MLLQFTKRRLVVAAAVFLALLLPSLILAYMLPGQTAKIANEPRYVVAIAVACRTIKNLPALTPSQKELFRYWIELGHEGADLAISFQPRPPNNLIHENVDRPRKAWETHIIVNPRTFRVERWYLGPD